MIAGLIDAHVHVGPCVVDRTQNATEVVREAVLAGFKGLVFKGPFAETASIASLARPADDSLEIAGGLVLGHTVGGINPAAVEAMFEIHGSDGRRLGQVVWMPSRDAEDHLTQYPRPGARPVTLWDDGRPRPELIEVIDLIIERDGVLATSHLGFEQALRLVRLARSRGLQKIVLTHAEMGPVSLSPAEQRIISDAGALIEHAYAVVFVGPQARAEILRSRTPVSIDQIVAGIRATGVERSILCTDFGGVTFGPPVPGMVEFTERLVAAGLTEDEVHRMGSRNSAELFGWT